MKLKGSLAQAGSSIVLNDGATAQATLQTTNTAAATFSLPAATDTLVSRSSTDTLTNKSIDGGSNTITGITDAAIAAAAGIPYSKLTLTGSVVNADVSASAAIAYSKLTLTGSVVNADVASGAAIAYSKLNLAGSVVAADIATSAAIPYSKLSLTGGIVNADVSVAAGIAYSKLNLSGSVATGDLASGLLLASSKGGTGVANNVASTLTISGAFGTTLTVTATTAVTLPTSGTLATLAGSETLTNKTLTSPVISTITNTGTLTLPTSTDTIVGRATTDTLSNKTLTSPLFSGYEDHTEIGTPANPASSTLRVYAKTDDNLYTLNSSGVETQVGSGAGEKNYLTSASSTASGWTAVAGTGATTQATVTVSTDTTSADLPRPYTTKKGIKFVATAASGGTPVAAFGWSTFQLDPADYNKKLKVQFDQNILGGYVSGDYSIEVRSKSTAWTAPARTDGTLLPLSTDSSAVTTIPALEGTFRTTFDAPGSATPYMAVFIVPKTTATSTLVLSDVVVGPGVVAQGAAVTQWQSFTPTISNVTSPTGIVAYYRRVGDAMEVRAKWAGAASSASGVFVSLPSGFTANTSALPSAGSDVLGAAYIAPNTGNVWTADVVYNTTTNVRIVVSNTNNNYNSTVPMAANAGDSVNVSFTVPINEWAGSGTVNVSQNDVEYAYNTSTADANDTASFGYGPAGTQFGSFSTATRTKRVRFLTPIQATDRIEVEVWDGASATGFVPISMIGGYVSTSATTGISTQQSGSTDIDVFFGSAGYGASTLRAAGAWSNVAASNSFKWRLKKTSGGQAVGWSLASSTASGLVSYEDSGTFTVNLGSAYAATQTPTIRYVRVGKMVTIFFPQAIAACNGALAITMAAGQWPLALRPAVTQQWSFPAYDNSGYPASVMGAFQLNPDGSANIYKSQANGTFTGSGNGGLIQHTASYVLN